MIKKPISYTFYSLNKNKGVVVGKQHLQKKNWTLAAMFALSLSLSACGGGGGGSSASGSDSNTNGGTQTPSVTVSSSVSTVAAGDGSVQLSAQITGSTSAVTWSISPAGIGSLDSTSGTQVKYIPPLAGTVLADTPVTITASAGQVSKSVSLTVQRAAGVALLAGDYGRMVDGPVSISKQLRPGKAVTDSKGNLYVINSGMSIRKITPDGNVSTIAGSVMPGTLKEGNAIDVNFSSLNQLAIAPDDTLYAIDVIDKTIKKITAAGVVSTIAGPLKPNSQESFNNLTSLAVAKDGSVVFADAYTDQENMGTYFPSPNVYRIKNGIVELLNSKSNINVVAMGVDSRNGDIYALESYFGGLVKLQITGNNVVAQPFQWLRGRGITDFNYTAVAINSQGTFYIASIMDNKVFAMNSGANPVVFLSAPMTEAEGLNSFQDGLLAAAKFSDVNGLAIDAADNLYLTEYHNVRVRKITATGLVSTISGAPYRGIQSGLAADSRFSTLSGVTLDTSGNIFLSESGYHAIRKLDKSGKVQVFAGGNAASGYADGIGSAAKFNNPMGSFINADGALIVADTYNQLIRKVDANQKVTTLAGTLDVQQRIDGSARTASFDSPYSVVSDKRGNIYVGEVSSIRKIGTDGQVSTVAGGNTLRGFVGGVKKIIYPDGPALSAGLGYVYGMMIDSKDNLLFADCYSHRIRKLTPNGEIMTVAGSVNSERGRTDGNGINARFACPKAVVADESDNLYVLDNSNRLIRKITPQGDVTTVVGNGSYLSSVGKLPANLTSLTGLAYDKNSRSLLVTTDAALFRVVLP